jgi:hypothetical protein
VARIRRRTPSELRCPLRPSLIDQLAGPKRGALSADDAVDCIVAMLKPACHSHVKVHALLNQSRANSSVAKFPSANGYSALAAAGGQTTAF